MDRQLIVKKDGANYHLTFHNFQGPFEGHQIGTFLGLVEDDPPQEVSPPPTPALNHYYLLNAMTRHPDLHALVASEKADGIGQILKRLQIRVIEGAELLPEEIVAAPLTSSANGIVADPGTPMPEHLSITEEMEHLHESVWHKGPKAVAMAFLARAIPIGLAIFAIVVVSRHVGDHYTEMSVDQAFAAAARPVPEQSLLAGIIDPDHSDKVKMEISTVRFIEGNRVITEDGQMLVFEGVRDVRSAFEQARAELTTPMIYARLDDGGILIEEIKVHNAVVARGGRVVQAATLGRCGRKPERGTPGMYGVFQRFEDLAYDDTRLVESLEGERVCFEGFIRQEDGRPVVRWKNGTGVALLPPKEGSPAHQMLAQFADSPTEIKVDVVVATIYPWNEGDPPQPSRQDTRLVGEATLYSASLQNYHLIAKE